MAYRYLYRHWFTPDTILQYAQSLATYARSTKSAHPGVQRLNSFRGTNQPGSAARGDLMDGMYVYPEQNGLQL
jgi:hypothetical protein